MKIELCSYAQGFPGIRAILPAVAAALIVMAPLPNKIVVKKDTEAFYIIATKERLNLSCPVKKNGEVMASEFYRECFSLPAETRAEELVMYEVRARE